MERKKSIIEFINEHKALIESISFDLICESTYSYEIKFLGKLTYKDKIIESEDRHISYTSSNSSLILSIGLDCTSDQRYQIATISFLNQLINEISNKPALVL